MKQAVAVVFVLLFLSTLIADGDCQSRKGGKRETEVKVILLTIPTVIYNA